MRILRVYSCLISRLWKCSRILFCSSSFFSCSHTHKHMLMQIHNLNMSFFYNCIYVCICMCVSAVVKVWVHGIFTHGMYKFNWAFYICLKIVTSIKKNVHELSTCSCICCCSELAFNDACNKAKIFITCDKIIIRTT